jgi:hypothetical protein
MRIGTRCTFALARPRCILFVMTLSRACLGRLLASPSIAAVLALAPSCSSGDDAASNESPAVQPGADVSGGSGGAAGAAGQDASLESSAGDGSVDQGAGGKAPQDAAADHDAADQSAPCKNLECKQVACDGGAVTSVSGKVYAPGPLANPDPLPNIIVYVPNAKVEPFPSGYACDRCSEAPSGSPLVRTSSGFDGTFMLEKMPAGKDIPLVLLSGRWRRQVVVPEVKPCQDNPLPADLTRLPRNKSEGDIPRMALQTGHLDALECTLAKLVDVGEITAPTGTGRVHLYRANGKDMSPPLPPATSLWSDPKVLAGYDIVLMPCACCNEDGSGVYQVPAAGVKNLTDYANAGGRLYITHVGGDWMRQPPEPFPGLVTWNNQPDPASPLACTVDTSFPKGQTFAKWLQALGVTPAFGELSLVNPQWLVDAVKAPARRWVFSKSPATVQHFTFNTPAGTAPQDQCGRVLFSNYHVVQNTQYKSLFPSTCPSETTLTVNEKLVEYMLFDVTACVQSDEL